MKNDETKTVDGNTQDFMYGNEPYSAEDFGLEEEKFGELDNIIKSISENPKEMQHIAIEASKLLTATENRLKEYKDSGFWRRVWLAISGQRKAMERANRSDITKMQKFAWFFLNKLQEQNLLQAQAIAVIRNNLRDVAQELSEIHDLIAKLTIRLGGRIKNIEDSLEQVKWLVYLDGRKDEFVDPERFPVICALQVVYDYINMLREKGLISNAYNLDIEQTVRVALSKFGIGKKFGFDNEDYTIESFIVTLFSEEKNGNFRKKVNESILLKDSNGKIIEITTEKLRKRVDGTCFNALYEYDRDMCSFSKLPRGLEDRILEAIRSNLNTDDAKYSLIEFASEIIGGYLIAIESNEQSVVAKDIVQSDEDKVISHELAFNQLRTIAGDPGTLKCGAVFHIDKQRIVDKIGNMCFTEYLPDGVSVIEKDGEWILPKKGRVEFLKGTQDVNTEKTGENASALYLDYEKNTGKFEGSFEVFKRSGSKIESAVFEVVGAMANGIGYGMAFSKGYGAFAVTIE